jgi:hypothetical protein
LPGTNVFFLPSQKGRDIRGQIAYASGEQGKERRFFMSTATVRIPDDKRDLLKIIASVEKTEIKQILSPKSRYRNREMYASCDLGEFF